MNSVGQGASTKRPPPPFTIRALLVESGDLFLKRIGTILPAAVGISLPFALLGLVAGGATRDTLNVALFSVLVFGLSAMDAAEASYLVEHGDFPPPGHARRAFLERLGPIGASLVGTFAFVFGASFVIAALGPAWDRLSADVSGRPVQGSGTLILFWAFIPLFWALVSLIGPATMAEHGGAFRPFRSALDLLGRNLKLFYVLALVSIAVWFGGAFIVEEVLTGVVGRRNEDFAWLVTDVVYDSVLGGYFAIAWTNAYFKARSAAPLPT